MGVANNAEQTEEYARTSQSHRPCTPKRKRGRSFLDYNFHVAAHMELLVGVYQGLKSFYRTLASNRGVGVLSGTYGMCVIIIVIS